MVQWLRGTKYKANVHFGKHWHKLNRTVNPNTVTTSHRNLNFRKQFIKTRNTFTSTDTNIQLANWMHKLNPVERGTSSSGSDQKWWWVSQSWSCCWIERQNNQVIFFVLLLEKTWAQEHSGVLLRSITAVQFVWLLQTANIICYNASKFVWKCVKVFNVF